MIKGEGDNMGKAKDMGVIGSWKEKNTKGKPLKNNAKHENELTKKKALQASRPRRFPQKKNDRQNPC
jgi:hypothetical protein